MFALGDTVCVCVSAPPARHCGFLHLAGCCPSAAGIYVSFDTEKTTGPKSFHVTAQQLKYEQLCDACIL